MTDKLAWSDEIDQLLIKLWDEGGSLQSVAADMQKLGYNVTPNSIAGRRHRLKGRFAAVRPPKQPKQRKPKPTNENRSKPMTIIASRPTLTKGQIDAINRDEGVNYLDNPENGCKAILDARGSDGLRKCCGKPRVDDFTGPRSPYCAAHTRLYSPIAASRSHHGQSSKVG